MLEECGCLPPPACARRRAAGHETDGNPLKSLLGKIGLPQAVGLVIDEKEVVGSAVVSTPLGPVEVARSTADFEQQPLAAAVDRVLVALVGKRDRRRVPVALGLPARNVFFSTRPIQTTSTDASPAVLLREALRSPTISIDDMAVDVIKARPGRRSLASIAACPRRPLAELLSTLAGCGVRPFRVEPGPCGLLRAGTRQRRDPLRGRPALRVFLGESRGLAILTAGSLPLVWRMFDLPRGAEAAAILATSRSLQTLSKHCGIEQPFRSVILHGRADLGGLLEFDWFQDEVGTRAEWLAEPAFDRANVAFGLAIGCFTDSPRSFDLARSLKPRASLRELFPWRELVVQAGLVACMAAVLVQHGRTLDASLAASAGQNQSSPEFAARGAAELETEKRELEQRVGAVRRFLGSRTLWTPYTRDLPSRLPHNVFLASLQGTCELGSAGKEKAAKPKKSLILKAAATIPPTGSVPHEIDRFLDSLREHPLLQKDFPVVELADLKQFQSQRGPNPDALFTVVCLPRPAKTPLTNGAAPAQETGKTSAP